MTGITSTGRKASLITIHGIHNYGSVLQAYATQRAIECVGADAGIIDYMPERRPQGLKGLASSARQALLKTGNSFLKDCLPGKPNSRYLKNYRDAKADWYKLEPKTYHSSDQLKSDPPVSEVYVVGSDQVWHPRTSAHDASFFLDFAPAGSKRVAFASSFGATSLPLNLHDHYRNCISKLDAICVREASGVRLVKQLTGRDAELVLDPTLLLSGDQWREQAVAPDVGEPYILCYGNNPPGSRYMEELALKISDYTGWRVVRMNGKFHNAFDRRMTYVLDAGPREWLGYMANASLILAQSFHATAYAVNFERPFLSILHGDKDRDSRQVDFLDISRMRNKSVVSGKNMHGLLMDILDFDFSEARSAVAFHRQRSLRSLELILS